MKKNYKKETLAKKIINSASDLRDLNYLDKSIGEISDNIKLDIKIMQKQMNLWSELYSEFFTDKKIFVKKYAKPNSPKSEALVKKFLNMPNA